MRDRPFEIGRAQETGPALPACRRVAGGRVGEGQRHPGVPKELTVGFTVEGQGIRRNDEPIAQLGDAQSVIRQRFVAIEKGPSGRATS